MNAMAAPKSKPKLCVCGERPATKKLGEDDVCEKCFHDDQAFGIRPKRKRKERK